MLQLYSDGKIILTNPMGYDPHVSVREIKKKNFSKATYYKMSGI